MTLTLGSRDIELLGRLSETLVAPLLPCADQWWRRTSQVALELFRADHAACHLHARREFLWREVDDHVFPSLLSLLGRDREHARRVDPIYFGVNAPRTRQACAIWNRVGSLRRAVASRGGTSPVFEIFHDARIAESTNIDLTGPFGSAQLCVSYARIADRERSYALASILAPSFRAGARAIACEQALVGDPRLTPRERQVASLLVARRRNHEIAALLGLSEHTVRHHVEAVFAKLGVHSRDEVAKRLGLSAT